MQANKEPVHSDAEGVATSNKLVATEVDGWPFRRTKDDLDSKVLRGRVTSSVEPDAEAYRMNHARRGVAVIFNHINFASMATRKGTVKDCMDLKVTLDKLGFEVRVYEDPSVKTVSTVLQSKIPSTYLGITDVRYVVRYRMPAELINPLIKAAAEDHTDADCLIVAAMSHGESGLLHTTNSLYPVDMLWTPFTGDRCHSLAGKPKLFFIQACRGVRLDKGVKIIHETDGKDTSYSIPAYADIMVAYSTYDGFYSWRNPDAGSWFIQAICEELNLHGRTRDLLTVMTFVNRRVAIEYQSYVPEKESFHAKKQIPSVVSMLTRLVYFGERNGLMSGQERIDQQLDQQLNLRD